MTSRTSMGRTGAKRCACGSGSIYDECCGRYHRGEPAPTAEALMRSRYTAFVMGDTPYLGYSWHPDTRPATIHDRLDRRWVQLDVLATSGGGLLDQEGTVEFDARYRDGDETDDRVLHEHSTFARFEGRWVYVDRLG